MLKKALIFLTGSLLIMALSVSALAEEQKVTGMIIIHPKTKDIKVVTKDYQYQTVYYDKKTKVEATVGAKLSDLEKEVKNNLPQGTVSYVIKDGKPVVTKISYKSKENWGIQKKAKKSED